MSKSSTSKETPKHCHKKVTTFKTNKSRKSKRDVREDILKFESFKIDAQGNMKMNEPTTSHEEKVRNRNSSIFKSTIMQHNKNEASCSNHEKFNVIKNEFPKIIDVRRTQVMSDVQHMTLYRSETSENVDNESASRRMYQKTEIQDGDKRIEILEIVECIDSSPESTPMRTVYRGGNCGRKSKIPVPIYKTGRSIGFQKYTRNNSRELIPINISLARASRLSMSSGNSKIDKLIARVLIDALNNQDGNVDFISSPRVFSKDRKTSSGKMKTLAPPSNAGHRRGALPQPSRRSANARYQQKFEVIPEERSSVSMESSTEDSGSRTTTSMPAVTLTPASDDSRDDPTTDKPTTSVSINTETSEDFDADDRAPLRRVHDVYIQSKCAEKEVQTEEIHANAPAAENGNVITNSSPVDEINGNVADVQTQTVNTESKPTLKEKPLLQKQTRTAQTSPDIDTSKANTLLNLNGNLADTIVTTHPGRAALESNLAYHSCSSGGWFGFCRAYRGSIAEESVLGGTRV